MKEANLQPSPDYSFLAAFGQPITTPKTGFIYLCCMALVTGAMLLLPLVYLAFVGALAWAVYHHAVHNWGPIMHLGGFTGGRIMIFKFLVTIQTVCAERGWSALITLLNPIVPVLDCLACHLIRLDGFQLRQRHG